MYRSGFVSLVGRPNVGKSSLLNAFLGEKLAIISPKPQTTRRRIQGILTRDDAQIVFVDTPGIHHPRNKLGEKMVHAAGESLEGVDAVLVVFDCTSGFSELDETIMQKVVATGIPLLAVWNKQDSVDEQQLKRILSGFINRHPGYPVFPVSALNGAGLDELMGSVIPLLPEGQPFYPDDILTDDPERFVVAELIREQALELLSDEVPHALAVEVNEMKDRGGESREYISATLFVERESQKGIIIGNSGKMLKEIGQRSREEIERLLDRPVFLDLWVKTKKDWRKSEPKLRELGFD